MRKNSICHIKLLLRRLTASAVLSPVRSSFADEKTNAAGSDVASSDPERRSHLEQVAACPETGKRVNSGSLRKQVLLSKQQKASKRGPKTVELYAFKEDSDHRERFEALLEHLPVGTRPSQVVRSLFRIGLAATELVTLGKVVRL